MYKKDIACSSRRLLDVYDLQHTSNDCRGNFGHLCLTPFSSFKRLLNLFNSEEKLREMDNIGVKKQHYIDISFAFISVLVIPFSINKHSYK